MTWRVDSLKGLALCWMILCGCVMATVAYSIPQSDSRLASAQDLLAEGILLEGIYLFEAYVADHPDALDARLQLAMALYEVGRFRAAADHAGYVYQADPEQAAARRLLVRIRSRLGRVIQQAESDPEQVLFIARLASVMGNVDRAASYYADYREMHEDPDVLLEWARMLRWNDDLVSATPLYHRYLEKVPDATDVQHELGRLYNARGRHAEAADILETAAQARPEDVDISLDWVRALMWSGQEQRGARILTDLIDAGVEAVAVRELLAAFYHHRQEYANADEQYRVLLTVNPDHADARWYTRLYQREHLLEIEGLRRDVAASPENRGRWVELIEMLHERQRTGEALRELDAYLALYPDDRQMMAQRDRIRQENRETVARHMAALQEQRAQTTVDMRQVLSRWLSHHPNEHQARYRLASYYAQAGLYREAVREYDQLISAGFQYPGIVAAREAAADRQGGGR